MNGDTFLAGQFDLHHERLRAVARRMLGSRHEAEEALSTARAAAGLTGIDSWLTTVVARVCVERLRARAGGRPEPMAKVTQVAHVTPEGVALADGTGLALFVVLDSLSPDERLALVLHDLFALPLPEVARLTGRTAAEAACLAERARRRVRGGAAESHVRPGREPR
ncbi:sigma factor-like helix-turn-helix DNA-binding protein [Streptomyces sp. NPDC050848]|uniref:sigma factor-like helix-turn-helix DNA-binding protein n=1 Tax=Streptomyces sp. NPDC050848 TaxID=3155791 RepID=UPI0033F8DAD8